MNLVLLDWLIIGVMLAAMVGIAIRTKFLNRSVADFLAGNRCARRYLLTMADGMTGLGAITIAANFEKFYESGFSGGWWGQLIVPVMLLITLTGFVIYRYRETRVLTMAQFFEVRYSRKFRIFSGFLAFFSGILNYGIFPAVTSRFIIYFCGLPQEFELFGFTMPMMAPVMFCLLTTAIILTTSGGQIAVIITDFLQGQFVQITIIVVFFILLSQISWEQVMTGLAMAPDNQSRINPLKVSGIESFNPAFFLMVAMLNVYGYKAWQGSQGYNAAPKNPHEAKMANILAMFRGQVIFLLTMLVPIFIYAMMQLPEFAVQQANVEATLALIDNPQIQKQMTVPVGLAQLLPAGVMGMFAAMIIAAAVSTDDTYLHSWGSILIQDVIMPFRKKPLPPKVHMFLLRSAIVGVAIFAFFFSLIFPLNEYILMYFQITGAIFLGGAGAVVLGGLYWKRGTVEGAWAAMIIGSTLSVSSIALRNIVWPFFLPGWKENHPEWTWLQSLPEKFPLHGVEMAFIVAIIAALSYVVFSLLSRRPPINMDKLLHRGEYAVETEGHQPTPGPGAVAEVDAAGQPVPPAFTIPKFWRRMGMTDEFTRFDRFIFYFKFSFTMFFVVVFLIGTPLALIFHFSDAVWVKYWSIKVWLSISIGLIATVWFLIGGFRDLFDLIRTLKSLARDENDDGWVKEEDHLQKKREETTP